MIASNILSLESKHLNHIWTELVHDNHMARKTQIEPNMLPINQSIEVKSSGKYYMNLTAQQINAKLEKHHDLIFAWNPIMSDLRARIDSTMYFSLFDQDGFCISSLLNSIGIQCSAARPLNQLIRHGAPIKVQMFYEENQSDAYANRIPDLEISFSRHNALIYPVLGEDDKIQGYVGVGKYDGNISEELGFMGYVSAKLLESKYMNIQSLKKYSGLLINGLPMCALLVDENGKIINVNEQCQNLFGITENDISSGAVNILNNVYGLENLVKGGNLPDSIENFSIKTADNLVIPCDLISKHVIRMPEYPNHFLVLFQKNEKSYRFDSKANFDDSIYCESAFNRLIGTTSNITHIKALGKKVARFSSNVLIEGASGTGKELLAEAIHIESRRRGSFIPINCGAISRELILSELFGYEDGAFTGAKRGGKKGVFEMADGGTVFLDEIGEMPIDMQVSLLRFLENRTITRVGSGESKKVDVRVIAATNRDLSEEVALGSFREDLYYRLNVFNIKIPPLSQRKEDIPLVAQHLLEKLCMELNMKQPSIDESIMDILINHDWPGNVRELRNVIEHALIICQGEEMTEASLPLYLKQNKSGQQVSGALAENEKSLIMQALDQFGGDITKSAKSLGLSRPTLYRKIAKMGISRKDYNMKM